MTKDAKPRNFHDHCLNLEGDDKRTAEDYRRNGIYDLRSVLNAARARLAYCEKTEDTTCIKKLKKFIPLAEEQGTMDGSFELTNEVAERVYNKVRANLTGYEEQIVDSFDPVRDADLIANYLFCVHPEIRKKVRNAPNMYKVVLKVGSQKKRSGLIPQRKDQDIRTPESNDQNTQVLSPALETLIGAVPRQEFIGDQEYQRRLRVLLTKKAERDVFHLFRDNPNEGFRLINQRIKENGNENIKDAYIAIKDIYQEYLDFVPKEANPEFRDPQTGEQGVLPSLHQKIAMYHLEKERRFGVFDGCGTGKTAIGILAQPIIERRMQKTLEERAQKGGQGFLRTVVVGPNPSKKAWKKGLIGKREERYLIQDNVSEEDVAVINGDQRKTREFVESLRNKKWIVMNYEQLTSEVNGTGRLLVDELIDMGVDYVISDEAHQIKEHKTVTKTGRPTRSGAFRKLANSAEYLALLTGSPIPDSMKDYAVLYHLLNPAICPDPEDFKKLYEENPRVLYTLFNEKSVRRTSEEINNDLEVDECEELVNLHPVQSRIYQHLREWRPDSWLIQARKALLDPRLVDPAVLKRTGLLGKVGYEHAKKYERLEEILTSDEGPITKGEKFVIFSSMFREGITRRGNDALRKRYVEEGVEEEFPNSSTNERRLLTMAVANDISSLEKLKKKAIAGRKNKEQAEGEFDKTVGSLVERGYISTQEDEFKINTGNDGAVHKYREFFDDLGFDKTLVKRLEQTIETKFGRRYCLEIIDGKIDDIEERERIVDQLNDGLTGILCTTETGGESLDFSAANHAFFLDRDYKPKTEHQAIHRLVRKGQLKDVSVHHFIGLTGVDVEPEVALANYVEKKKIIIATATDGYPITEDEQKFLDDGEGRQYAAMLKRGLGGKPINTLEVKVNDINMFTVKKRTHRRASGVAHSQLFEEHTTKAQEIMKEIGRDPVNCWQNPDFAQRYVNAFNELAPNVIHRAKIIDLIKRANQNEIVFPGKVVSEGSGHSILYRAYQDLIPVLRKHGFSVPLVVDRDVSKAMLALGKNPNQVLGSMTGENSQFSDEEFEMVDNASISLLRNRGEVKRTLLEAHRILRPEGLLELTAEDRVFYDGSSIPDEELQDGLDEDTDAKKKKPDFYKGLGHLGFEILSGKNQRFAVDKRFFKPLREQHGTHFAEAYARKLADTCFILARKVDNPQDNVDEENFWWRRPEASVEETEREEDELIMTPEELRSIITSRSRRKSKSASPQQDEEFKPEREVKVDGFGNVVSVKKPGRK